jgi:hypothetical protein
MNVEDSYEGAVRRLQRLEMAGIAMESPQAEAVDEAVAADSAERMRELEELATLACEDNERLKAEFGTALQELDDARRELDGRRAEIGRAQRELGEARREIDQLRGYVASLEETLESAQRAAASVPQPAFAPAPQQASFPTPQQAFAPAPQQASFPTPQQAFAPALQPAFEPAPEQAFAPARPSAFVSPFATEALPEEDYGYPPKSTGKGAKYFFVLATAGAVVAALCVMRPWDRPHPAPPVAVELPTPAPAPVATAPKPVAKVEPTLPKLAPTVPKVEPTIPKTAPAAATHAPRAAKTRSERKQHPKHHPAKKHTSARAQESAPGASDDPLSGTNL